MNLASSFPLSFGPDIWGITASDSPKGYKIYGEIKQFEAVDGTVAPCAAGGSLMFTPDISIPALRAMRDHFQDRVYRAYGFVDAFNPGQKWFDDDVVGIDAGITLLSAENLLTGDVWKWFMANPTVPHAMELVGLVGQTTDFSSVHKPKPRRPRSHPAPQPAQASSPATGTP